MSCRTILLSIHPKYAENIIAGEKRLEFRRSWTSLPIDMIAIYATAPVQRVIGIAEVRNVFAGSPTSLWHLANSKGGCISRRKLFSYLKGKKKAYAIELGQVFIINGGSSPISIFGKDFRPPQSFRYLNEDEYLKIKRLTEKD